MRPLVSVIIPTYNRRERVLEAIDSVLSQSYGSFELIVVDDGSGDGTREALKAYAGRLRYIFQENQGPSSARNRGIREAKGELISFLDSDDLWLRDKLCRQVAFMEENPEARVCYTEELWIRNGRRVNPMRKHAKLSGDIFERALELCIVSPSSAMLRRELLLEVGGFDEELPLCEDYDLWLRIAKDHPFHLIPEALIIKRGGHADQLSRSTWGLDRFRVRAIVKLLGGGGLSEEKRTLAQKALERKCAILAEGCYKRGKREEGDSWRRLALRYGARRMF